jgi:hypothetical protein
MAYVKVNFGDGPWQLFPGLVESQGAPFQHYRLGLAQAYAVEVAIAHHEMKNWLPRFRLMPIAYIECSTGELSEHVTVANTVVAPDGRAALVQLDAVVMLMVEPSAS